MVLFGAVDRFPLPTTEEWGEGKGEGIPISCANSMEGAPLPSPLPARASQGEGAGGFRDGGGIQMRLFLKFLVLYLLLAEVKPI